MDRRTAWCTAAATCRDDGWVLGRCFLIAVLVAAGCSPDSGSGDGQSPAVVLDLNTAGSRTAFMTETLTAPTGSRVVLRLTNDGELPHNVVVVLSEQAVKPIVLAAYRSIKTEYVPTGFDDDILASTRLVYPGETVEVEFVMPAPGSYTYVCVFPGHAGTMRGTLVSTR